MPITDFGSYKTTGDEFDVHWQDVNADRAANTLPDFELNDGYKIADLQADVVEVDAAVSLVDSIENDLDQATTNRDNLRTTLRDKLIEFREAVDYNLEKTGYQRALPETFHQDASEQKTMRALKDMADLWTKINADTGVANFTPPLILRENYTLADFQTDRATLESHYKAVTEAEGEIKLTRKRRDVLLTPLKTRFVKYREGIQVAYGDEHPFTLSLPEVYPPPGSTPKPVTASSSFDDTTNEGVVTFTESTDSKLANYQLRGNPDDAYDAENAVVIDSLVAGSEPREFRTTQFLANPGDEATFKVYVVLTTGNEAGSNPVTITHPVLPPSPPPPPPPPPPP